MLRDSRDIIRRLESAGFELISIAGSHHKFVHRILRRRVIVPHPKRDLPVGTVRAIYRDAGLAEGLTETA
jgi:predicted RNA binding protein YcfA (HicA-like mRNA interferase family)